MAKKRKTLVDNMQEIIDSGDLEAFKAVFDKCEITATNRGKTTSNALSYKGLTPAHIQFLIDNGIDVNKDAGWNRPAVAHQSYSLDNLRCLIDNGADVDLYLNSYYGNAMHYAALGHNPTAISNLLACGASPHIKSGWKNHSPLDEALSSCMNIDIVNTLEIAKMLLDAGAKKTEKSKEYVHKIGERFEFMRPDFNKESVDEVSAALDELYVIFDVEPVPRRVVYDGKSKIVVKSDTWQKQHAELWDMLVPGRGVAGTIQGELIRIVGKALYEILDNGGINWDDEYRKMMKAMINYFHMADGLESNLVEEACNLAKNVSSRSDEKMLYRLNELTVKWIVANPDPIALEQVEYKR